MRIAFRVDGSKQIGTGHVVRCLTLADILAASGHPCRFIMRDLDGAPFEMVEGKGHALSILPAQIDGSLDELAHAHWLGTSQADDARATIAALDGQVDWLVVDHYALDHRWEQMLRARSGNILAIDDIADRRHDCDILLDQNLQAEPNRYQRLVPSVCKQLLGPRFALLAPRFAELRNCPVSESRESILVYFGGIDAGGVTLRTLEAISLAKLYDRPLDVVVGDRNPHRDTILDWCAHHSSASFHGGGTDMAALMAKAGLAIGAAGTTAWERCCLGLSTLIVTIAENQKPGATALAREGAAIFLGDQPEVDAPTIAAALVTLNHAPDLAQLIGEKASALTDGRGAERVANTMMATTIVLRLAESTDCDVVWKWRNDERTRRHFFDPNPVSLEDHRKWFAATLANPARALLLGEIDGKPIGVLRYDREGDVAITSVYLVPGREGRGEGARLIQAGTEWVASHWPGLAAIEADVLKRNPASAKAFENAGFEDLWTRFRKELEMGERDR